MEECDELHEYEYLGRVTRIAENGYAALDTGETLGPLFLTDPEEGEAVYYKESEDPLGITSFSVIQVPDCRCGGEFIMGDETFICPVCNSYYDVDLCKETTPHREPEDDGYMDFESAVTLIKEKVGL